MSKLAKNYGFIRVNDAPVYTRRTIAATGLGRSGTTMLARVMHDIGLDMGTRLTSRSAEDRDIQQLLKKRALDQFEDLCRKRDTETDCWAFKCPSLRGEVLASVYARPHKGLKRGVLKLANRRVNNDRPLAA